MVSMWRRLLGSRNKAASRARHIPAAKLARAGTTAPLAAPAAVPTDSLPVVSTTQIRTRFLQYVFGLPGSESQLPSTFELSTLTRLELLSIRFDMRSLPRLPSVLPQLMRLLKNDNAAGNQWARLVGRDPLMVGEVMRVARSASYRSAQPIRSLQHAVILLGQEGLRRVLTQHVMKPILHSSAGRLSQLAGERLWEHSERCAHACAWLGKHGGCDAFEAYLAGIVSHAGTGAVVRLLDQLMPEAPVPLSTAFLLGCAQLAARLSVQAAQYWDLPANVIEALVARQLTDRPANDSPLAAALTCADVLAMAQLLGEHELLAADLDLRHAWPDVYAASLLAACQQDLRRQFAGDHGPAT
ncbi:MAG: HDOD domain-containing protein [Xanthomonadaceae bacterium]|nr:HDOD domain-containing protein [Xanthomonadaceae bacterium]